MTTSANYTGAPALDPASVKVLSGATIDSAPSATRENYELDGWYTNADATQGTKFVFSNDPEVGTKVTKNTDLYANWLADYTIAFNPNASDAEEPDNTPGDAKLEPIEAVQGTEYTLKANTFVRPGYKFKEWNTEANGSGTKIADEAKVKDLSTTGGATVTLYAQWEPITYTVYFQNNDGTGDMGNQQLTYGETKLNKNTLTRTGYKFLGWSTDKSASEAAFEDEAVPAFTKDDKVTAEDNGSIQLFAIWEELTYKITLDANGGTITVGNDQDAKQVASLVIEGAYGQKLENLETKVPEDSALSRTGFEFSGWDKAIPESMPAEDLTITAQWGALSYDVTFNMGGHGERVPAQKVSYNGQAKKPATDPTATGLKFDGWFVSADDNAAEFNFAEPITKATEIFAKWSAATYAVTFDLQGGAWPSAQADVVNPQTIEYNNGAYYPYKVTATTQGQTTTYSVANDDKNVIPYKAGNTFEGWFVDSKFETAAQLSDVTGQNNGFDVTTGAALGVPNEPTLITGDTTFYAKWKPITYTLEFDLNGGKFDGKENVDSQTVEYEQTFTEPDAAKLAKDGYTFAGWYTDDNTFLNLYSFDSPVTTSIKLHAKWSQGTYVVTFDKNSAAATGEMDSQTVTYYAEGTDPAPVQPLAENKFAREGYAFQGWNDKADGTGDIHLTDKVNIVAQIKQDVRLYAQWGDPIEYTVTFDGNGATDGALAPQKIAYSDDPVKLKANANGDDPNVDKAFVRTQYLFVGWNTDKDGKGTPYADEAEIANLAENITLYAQWFPSVTVTFNSNPAEGTAVTATQDVKKGEATDLDAFEALTGIAAPNGKAFKEWNTEANGSGTSYADGASVAFSEATTLYAIWKDGATVTFEGEDGVKLDEQVIEDLSKGANAIYSRTEPKKDADEEFAEYKFQGWRLKTAAADTEEIYKPDQTTGALTHDSQAYKVDHDVTFVAVFAGGSPAGTDWVEGAKKQHTVTFEANGEAVLTQTKTYGDKLEVPDLSYTSPQKFPGYTFNDKWLKEDGTAWDFAKDTVTGAITLKADMTTDQEAEDKKAADKVADAIAALPDAATVILSDKEAVDEAKVAYDALTDAQKELVSDEAKAKLDAVVEKTAKLAEDKAAADAVAEAIAKLPAAADATADTKAAADAAKDAYEALTDDQKALISEADLATLDAVSKAADQKYDEKAYEDVAAAAKTASEDAAKAAADAQASLEAAQKAAEEAAAKGDVDSANAAVEAAAKAQADAEAAQKAAEAAEAAQKAAQEAATTAAASAKAAGDTASADKMTENAEAAGKAATAAADQAKAAAEYKTQADDAKKKADDQKKAADDASKTKVAAPTAVKNLKYNGKAQTGVKAATGYTLTGNTATKAGTFTATAKLADGYIWSDGTTADKTVKYTIAKAANPLKAKAKAKTLKAKAAKKTTIKKAKAFKITGAQGKVTFAKANKAGGKKIVVKSNGTIVVKKGLKKGKTYKVTVKVTAKGNTNYNKVTKKVTLKIKVKK